MNKKETFIEVRCKNCNNLLGGYINEIDSNKYQPISKICCNECYDLKEMAKMAKKEKQKK